ncbi:hypothetical protein SBADM41S_03446 [Streptomyces badius]
MLREPRHQLDVCEPEVLDVRGQLLGQLTVGQARSPGGEMYLVHRERGFVDRPVAPVCHPVRVLPLVVLGGDDRRRRGRHLGAPGHRVGPHRVRTVRADVELVQRALADPRQEQLPHPGRAEPTHREARAVPVVEVTRDPHTPRVRCPPAQPFVEQWSEGRKQGPVPRTAGGRAVPRALRQGDVSGCSLRHGIASFPRAHRMRRVSRIAAMAVRLCGTCRERKVLTDSNGGTVKAREGTGEGPRPSFRSECPVRGGGNPPRTRPVPSQAACVLLRSRNQ